MRIGKYIYSHDNYSHSKLILMNHYQEEYVFAKAISFTMDRNLVIDEPNQAL